MNKNNNERNFFLRFLSNFTQKKSSKYWTQKGPSFTDLMYFCYFFNPNFFCNK